jgi:hypothetical protein
MPERAAMTDAEKADEEAPHITPEMLEAGREAAGEHALIFEDAARDKDKDELIIAVYCAMAKASQKDGRADP